MGQPEAVIASPAARSCLLVTVVLAIMGCAHCVRPDGSTPSEARANWATPASTDDELVRRIREVRGLARGIVIDGEPNDWQGIPAIDDTGSIAPSDGALDIRRTALAPREHDILVLVAFRSPPRADGWHYSIALDLWGDRRIDCRFDIDGPGLYQLYLYGYSKRECYYEKSIRAPEASVSMGTVLEVAIPYEAIGHLLAAAGRTPEIPLRNWIRAEPMAWDGEGASCKLVKEGPAIACYRLLEDPAVSDPPLPDRRVPPQIVGFPLSGIWHVTQGPMTSRSHEGEWAYDFDVVDRSFRVGPSGEDTPAGGRYGWGQPVYAPEGGRILTAEDSNPDHDTRGGDEVPEALVGEANEVELQLASGTVLRMAHLMKGSVPVREADLVGAGAVIGRVGNSGNSWGPHLHLALRAAKDSAVYLPIALRSVRVKINPLPLDPWERVLESWPIREGYLVERATPFPEPPASVDRVRER